jgi:hypothetical protein
VKPSGPALSTRRAPRRALLRLLAVALASPAHALAQALPSDAAARTDAAPETADQTRQLRFALTLINPQQKRLSDQHLWCYLPAELPPTQHLQQVTVSMPHQIETDASGHRILALHLAELAPLAQKIVSVSLSVQAGANTEQALPDPARWLGAERFIESDDARMAAAARAMQRDSPRQSARAIYDWVQQHMHYSGYLADDLGALHALTRASGDCTEYAFLVVALARALGIPARMVGGYVQTQDAILRAQDYHNWAELYLERRWQILDAQKGSFMPPPGQYVAFRLYRDKADNPVGLAHRWRQQGEMQVVW